MRFLVLTLTMLLNVQNNVTGNNVVNCAACRTVEQRVESWECKVNCEVTQGSQDDVVTYGVISDLIERLHRLEENSTVMAQRITELEAPTEVFSAHGYHGVTRDVPHSDGQNFLFPVEFVDRLNSYDNITGVFTAQNNGVYSIGLVLRSTGSTGAAIIYVKKPGETEEPLCTAKGNNGGHDSICLLIRPLIAGEQVYVKFSGSGQVNTNKSYFHAILLYKTN